MLLLLNCPILNIQILFCLNFITKLLHLKINIWRKNASEIQLVASLIRSVTLCPLFLSVCICLSTFSLCFVLFLTILLSFLQSTFKFHYVYSNLSSFRKTNIQYNVMRAIAAGPKSRTQRHDRSWSDGEQAYWVKSVVRQEVGWRVGHIRLEGV